MASRFSLSSVANIASVAPAKACEAICARRGGQRARNGWVKGARGQPAPPGRRWILCVISLPSDTSLAPREARPLHAAVPSHRRSAAAALPPLVRCDPSPSLPTLILQPARRATRSLWWCGAARSTLQKSATAGGRSWGSAGRRQGACAGLDTALPMPWGRQTKLMNKQMSPCQWSSRCPTQAEVRADNRRPEEGGSGKAGCAARQAAGGC